MKVHDIRELPQTELVKRIRDEEENLVHLKFQKATSQLESPIRIRSVRRDIARMKTVLAERERAAAPAAPVAATAAAPAPKQQTPPAAAAPPAQS